MSGGVDIDSADARLWDKISPEPNSGCWLWSGADVRGYGSIGIKGKTYLAHRITYELFRGPIPPELTIDHLCRVRCCVNPDHLEVVTLQENIARANPGEINRGKTHCKFGHPFSGNNLILYRGGRYCRACKNKRNREYMRRRRTPSPARGQQ